MKARILLLTCLTGLSLQASERKVAVDLTAAAQTFMASLSEEQKNKLCLPFDSEDREKWHYFPMPRNGLSWSEMNPKQQELSWKFLQAVLSDAGYDKTRGIVEAERILWEASGNSDYRDPGKFFICIFGKPDTDATWAASLEGHHLSINLTIVAGKAIAATPSFMGASPDRFPDGTRPLARELDQAIHLIESLEPDQGQRALLAEGTPRDIVTRADRQVSAMAREGLPASKMNKTQQSQLRRLIGEYVDRHRRAVADDDWAKIEKAGIANIHFSWSGEAEVGKPLYYRIQGPTFIMEYANVQDGGNHSHTVWRDFEDDFGRDSLKHHFESHPH